VLTTSSGGPETRPRSVGPSETLVESQPFGEFTKIMGHGDGYVGRPRRAVRWRAVNGLDRLVADCRPAPPGAIDTGTLLPAAMSRAPTQWRRKPLH